MFRRKKKEEAVQPVSGAETPTEDARPEALAAGEGLTSPIIAEESAPAEVAPVAAASEPVVEAGAAEVSVGAKSSSRARGNRVQKIGIVSSDKMQKTVVVRVDRLVLHRKYRRYVRRTSKFMAHDDLGSTTGDRVRIVETRPLSAHKRWRVVEIVQKAAK
jgi:small subunit ribosomal protein S17